MIKLAEIRKSKNLSQNDLIKATGISRSVITKYESGERNINKASGETLLKLATALSCNQPLTTYGRIIGSINSKSGQTIKVMYLNEKKYTLKELQSKWLEPLPQWYPEWKAKSNRKVINLSRNFTTQSSFYKYNELRINDIYRIQKFYEYDCDGFKRFLCFQLRNHLILNGVSHEDAKNQMLEFNQNFKKPLNWRVIESDTRNFSFSK